MSKLILVVSLTVLSACSTPQFTVNSPNVCPSPPENLMTPARPLLPLIWLEPSVITTTKPGRMLNS